MKRVAILFLIVALAGCATQQSQSNLQIKGYWDKISSFKTEVTYTIGNESYEADIVYVKPDRVMKIENGTVVLIDGDMKTVVSEGKMFKLAASDFDLDTLDPFVAILNNLDSLNFKAEDGKLVVTSEDFSFAVELNSSLPAKIAVVYQNSTIAIASYINISINDAEVNDSIIYDFLQPENESRLRGVYYFFSPYCPHCSEVKPIVKMCNVTYCNVSNMSADCMEVMQRYGVMFVPTIVSVNELNTTIFVGEKNIREGFGVWCRYKMG